MLIKNIIYTLLLFILIFMIVIALYNIVLFVGSDYNIHFLEIDKCADHGGRWDHHANECEY
jgi:hypothetical protein